VLSISLPAPTPSKSPKKWENSETFSRQAKRDSDADGSFS
jgi:hypothetical protein